MIFLTVAMLALFGIFAVVVFTGCMFQAFFPNFSSNRKHAARLKASRKRSAIRRAKMRAHYA